MFESANTNDQAQAFSEKVFGFSWKQHTPLTVGSFSAEVSDCYSCFEFITKNREDVLQSEVKSDGFHEDMPLWSRDQFYGVNGDFLKISRAGKIVGFFVGTSEDWSTYYLRYIYLLKSERGTGFIYHFVRLLISILSQSRAHRITVDVSPAHLGQVHLLTKLEFNITGFALSERWGALVRMTYFLNVEAREEFLTRFCRGMKPQLINIERGIT